MKILILGLPNNWEKQQDVTLTEATKAFLHEASYACFYIASTQRSLESERLNEYAKKLQTQFRFSIPYLASLEGTYSLARLTTDISVKPAEFFDKLNQVNPHFTIFRKRANPRITFDYVDLSPDAAHTIIFAKLQGTATLRNSYRVPYCIEQINYFRSSDMAENNFTAKTVLTGDNTSLASYHIAYQTICSIQQRVRAKSSVTHLTLPPNMIPVVNAAIDFDSEVDSNKESLSQASQITIPLREEKQTDVEASQVKAVTFVPLPERDSMSSKSHYSLRYSLSHSLHGKKPQLSPILSATAITPVCTEVPLIAPLSPVSGKFFPETNQQPETIQVEKPASCNPCRIQ